MTFALRTQIFNNKSGVLVILAVLALNACENSAEPPQPTVIHFAAVTATNIAGVVATEVTSVPVVRVTDGKGNPLAGFPVSFRTRDGGVPGNVTALTDNSGMASVGSWKLGPKAGSQTLQAFYNVAVPFGRAATGDTAVFTAVAKAGPLASVVAVDGVDQFGHTGGTLLTPLRVMALDSFGNPVPGVHVSFSVVTGSGRIDGADASTGSDGEAASGIWTLGPEAGPQDVRADAGTAQVMFRATACEPNACRLLFIRSRNIFTWDAGTSRQLTAGNCSNFARASRDGNRIAFVRDDCDGEIILTDADGSNVTRLTAAAVNGGLAWSPDGRALALGNHGFIDILNLNQNDGTPTRLVDGHDPDWSPDGKRILFVTANSAIRTVNADGSDTVEILPSENRYDEVSFDSPKWSPDGKRIAFTRCDEITCDIYVMQADGSELKRLTRDRGFAGISSYSPSWSPDGKRIAFTRSGDPTSTYYVNDTGGEPTLLINSAYYAEWLR